MRDLANVVTIENVIPMEGKDRIVCVTFKENAYECIIPKEQAIPGNLIAFIQEGAVLPVKPQWEFLRKRCYKDNLDGKEGFLIKPMVMGKKIDGTRVKSWGLGVSLNELGLDEATWKKFKAGDSIEELLEIWKYENAEDASPRASSKKAYPKWVKFCLSHTLIRWIGRAWQKKHQNSAGGFPLSLISISDETTIQSMKGTLEKYAESKVNITCVAADTLIDTVDGQKTIKEIVDTKYSGEVLSYNEKNSMIEPKKILSYSVAPDESDTEWFEIELENGKKLQITGNDNVYLPELKCYRKVKDLNGDEKLLLNL